MSSEIGRNVQGSARGGADRKECSGRSGQEGVHGEECMGRSAQGGADREECTGRSVRGGVNVKVPKQGVKDIFRELEISG